MAQIDVTNLTFCYEGSYDNVFTNVSFRIDTDWKLGFIGRNGRGKTTFLKLLMGEYEYKGNINASVKFEYFPYIVNDKTKGTYEIVSEIVNGSDDWKIYRELNLLKVNEDVLQRPFETLSNGEQTKVLLAALFIRENSFLLIDEPTNHLDSDAREIVANYLKGKNGFILVSHDRHFLDSCIDHVISINKQNIEIKKCNFTEWYYNKMLADDYEQKQNERLCSDIDRLSKAARKAASWSDKAEKKKNVKNSGLRPDKGFVSHKAAKMMQRAKNAQNRIETALEEKQGLLKNIEKAEKLKLSPEYHYQNRLLSLENVSICYGGKIACENISFEVNNGERVCLSGKNGCGKTSVLKLINGFDIQALGNITKAPNLKISYVAQDTSGLHGNLYEFAAECGIDETLFLTILRKMDFSRIQFEKDIADYSAGQKKKVLVAKSLCESTNLYIWDEPLNYIDIFSRIQIEKLILEYCPTLLFVEHDAFFKEKIATKEVNIKSCNSD